MKRLILTLFTLSCISTYAQDLLSAEKIAADDTTSLRFIYSGAKYNVETYKIKYTTKDINDSLTVASGALMIPLSGDCNLFPLVSYNHGTVLNRADVPSRNNFEAMIPKLMASTGKIALSADYLGLGDNKGLHPYLHAESEATVTIDLIRACRAFIRDSLEVSLNGEVFLTGYSQGGHAAMATAKYIQDNNLSGEFDIRAVAPASGPYNLSGTQSEVLMSNAPYSNPAYVCYLLFAYQRVYGNLYTDYSDILKSPYDSLIPPYFDGTYAISAVNAILPSRINEFLQDSVLLNFSNDSIQRTHPLWRALLDNDNYDWAPSFPMELYYCTQDEQVSFQNALDAEAAMQNRGVNVSAVNKGPLDHFNCLFPSLEGAIAFFEAHGRPCQKVGLSENGREGLRLYPNPAGERITIENFEGKVRIIDLSGRIVLQAEVSKENPFLSVRDLNEGIYLLTGEEFATGRKIVIRR